MIEHVKWCDGYRTAHLHEEERDGIHVRRLICAEDGAVTPWVGNHVSQIELHNMATCMPQIVECDGRCREWDR